MNNERIRKRRFRNGHADLMRVIRCNGLVTKLEFDYNPTHFFKYNLSRVSDILHGPYNIIGFDTKEEMNHFIMGLWLLCVSDRR